MPFSICLRVKEVHFVRFLDDSRVTVFIGIAGNGDRIYPTWVGTTSTAVDARYDGSTKRHYKSVLVDDWRNLQLIKKVGCTKNR